jgi:signal peptidase I
MRGNKFTIALCSLLATGVIGLVLAVHFLGISVYVITGASMTGAIPKGAIAFDRQVPVAELQVGDVITFRPPGVSGNITHRIVAVDRDAEGRPVFRTKGDANQAVDPWRFTLDRPVQARYVCNVPWMGYVLAAFTFRAVRTAILAAVGLVLLALTVAWFRKPRMGAGDESPGEQDRAPLCE